LPYPGNVRNNAMKEPFRLAEGLRIVYIIEDAAYDFGMSKIFGSTSWFTSIFFTLEVRLN
jgi:hypothetical protein